MPTSNSLADLPGFPLVEGLLARVLFTERMTVSYATLEPGVVLPPHEHPHEQVSIVLEGELRFRLGDEDERALGPLDAIVAPPGVPHSAVAGPAGARVLDVWAPVREDYREKLAAAQAG